MSSKTKSIIGALTALTFAVGGLAGCSDTKSDKAACTSFGELFASAQDLAETDPAEAAALFTDGGHQAAAKAKDPELALMMDEFTTDYPLLVDQQLGQTTNDDADFFTFLATFLRIGEACEAAGVEIEGYTEMKADLEADGFTADDLDALTELNSSGKE